MRYLLAGRGRRVAASSAANWNHEYHARERDRTNAQKWHPHGAGALHTTCWRNFLIEAVALICTGGVIGIATGIAAAKIVTPSQKLAHTDLTGGKW